MNEPDITIEDKSEGKPIEVKTTGQTHAGSSDTIEDFATSVKDLASKISDSVSRAVERAISGRDLPLMVRVGDETLKRIDQLVEVGLFKSRSESAAFLIGEGIRAQAALFEKIESKIQEIDKLRQELKNLIQEELIKPST